MCTQLELFTGLFVDMWRAQDGEAVFYGRQRNRAQNPRSSALSSIDDFRHRLVENTMIVRLQANSDLLRGRCHSFPNSSVRITEPGLHEERARPGPCEICDRSGRYNAFKPSELLDNLRHHPGPHGPSAFP